MLELRNIRRPVTSKDVGDREAECFSGTVDPAPVVGIWQQARELSYHESISVNHQAV